jgi:hypothetical protein
MYTSLKITRDENKKKKTQQNLRVKSKFVTLYYANINLTHFPLGFAFFVSLLQNNIKTNGQIEFNI